MPHWYLQKFFFLQCEFTFFFFTVLQFYLKLFCLFELFVISPFSAGVRKRLPVPYPGCPFVPTFKLFLESNYFFCSKFYFADIVLYIWKLISFPVHWKGQLLCNEPGNMIKMGNTDMIQWIKQFFLLWSLLSIYHLKAECIPFISVHWKCQLICKESWNNENDA